MQVSVSVVVNAGAMTCGAVRSVCVAGVTELLLIVCELLAAWLVAPELVLVVVLVVTFGLDTEPEIAPEAELDREFALALLVLLSATSAVDDPMPTPLLALFESEAFEFVFVLV